MLDIEPPGMETAMKDKPILIVRDSPVDTGQIVKMLTDGGFPVRVVDSCPGARAALREEDFCLVILIPRLAGDDRFDARGFLLDDGVRRKAPLLLLVTAEFAMEDYFDWLGGGMGHYLAFPFGKKYFLGRVKAVIAGGPEPSGESGWISLDLSAGAGKRSLKVRAGLLGETLISAFENGIHQRAMLQQSHKKLNLLNDAKTPAPVQAASGRSTEKIRQVDGLIEAIERSQFEMFYQPIVDMKAGTISGFEALMRWRHPERGFISPAEFIPIAEETGLIIPLGLWAIESTARQLGEWHGAFTDREPVTSSVNLSTVQFIHPGLAEQILEIVDGASLDHDALRFEITESALMADMETANIMLLKLKSMKFKLYMDDFGTGYSSLSYLRHFPMDVLKIDQSFVKWMGVDDESSQIVKTIIDLAHNLGKQVVAEGIETAEHLAELRSLGCDFGQGYFFSKPVDAGAATELLAETKVW